MGELVDKDKELERVRKEAERIRKKSDDTHNDDMERILTLEKSQQEDKAKISGLERTIAQKDEELGKKEANISMWQKFYLAAIEVGKYLCKRLGLHLDFEKAVDMREDGYRLNYIFGDDDRTR